MKEVVGNQGFSWNVLFPNEANFGKMCKNCFKVFGYVAIFFVYNMHAEFLNH